ncbi:alpha-galactosidase [Ilyomonas limi]|nr:alpha-galactosidase [Ilyomonas limi]
MLVHSIKVVFLLLFLSTVINSFSQVSYNGQKKEWTVRSGKNRYIITNTPEGIEQAYLTDATATVSPAAEPDYHLVVCTINGQQLNAADFTLTNNQTGNEKNGVAYLMLTLQAKKSPLQAIVTCKAYNNTGVFTRSINIKNTSQQAIHIANIPSFSASLPGGNYDLQYLKTEWGHERRFTTEALQPDSLRSFIMNRGRSGEGYSSWFSLVNNTTSVRYMAELAYSGNWQMQFLQKEANAPVTVQMGMRFDKGEALTLLPSATFQTPEVAFTLDSGDLDEVANYLHRYQREFVIPAVQTNRPLLVEYNTWFATPNKVYVKEVKRLVDSAAALGCEAFVLDAGWYNEQEQDWSAELGNWYPTKTSFPNGLEELVNYVHQNNMLFGLWVEIESVGRQSNLVKEHPGWFLQNEGKPVFTSNRYHLNFANDSARNWALHTISRLVNTYQLKWIKIDYNNSVGESFDAQYNGIALYEHLQGYFKLLDAVHHLFPSLIVENCASGGLRTDLGTMKHTNTAWLSDITYPHNAPQLVWGATLELTPGINNYWMTGDTVHQDVWFCKEEPLHPEWWNYMFRIAMTGQFGISSRLERWSKALMDTAKQNIQLYKRIRTIIQGADVYHLTPMPDHDKPVGSMAIQYQNNDKNLLMAYRLENGKDEENYKLRNLDAAQQYVVYIDGKKIKQLTGGELMNVGITVNLKYDFSAAVIEMDEVQ